MMLDSVNIGGWLKTYLVYLGIGATLNGLSLIYGLWHDNGVTIILIDAMGLGLYSFLFYSLTQTSKPWVRNLHIAFNAMVGLSILGFLIRVDLSLFWIVRVPWILPLLILVPHETLIDHSQIIHSLISWVYLAVTVACIVYWVRSKRISDTYLTGVSHYGSGQAQATHSKLRAFIQSSGLVGGAITLIVGLLIVYEANSIEFISAERGGAIGLFFQTIMYWTLGAVGVVIVAIGAIVLVVSLFAMLGRSSGNRE